MEGHRKRVRSLTQSASLLKNFFPQESSKKSQRAVAHDSFRLAASPAAIQLFSQPPPPKQAGSASARAAADSTTVSLFHSQQFFARPRSITLLYLHSIELISCISDSCHAQVSAEDTAPSTLQPNVVAQCPFAVQNLPIESHVVRFALFPQRSSSRLLPFHVKRPPKCSAPATMPCPLPARSKPDLFPFLHPRHDLPLVHILLPAALLQLLVQDPVSILEPQKSSSSLLPTTFFATSSAKAESPTSLSVAAIAPPSTPSSACSTE